MPVTLKTIAEKAGVSVMAVSAVLNQTRSTRVSAATRERILQVAHSLEYRINLGARSLRCKRTNLIGVLVWDLSGNVTGSMLAGIDQTLTETGYGMLASAYNSFEMLREKIDIMLARDVDGVILPGESRLEYLTEFSRLLSGRPAICIGAQIPGSNRSWISTDKISAANQVFEHLYKLGHRDFLLLGGRFGFENEVLKLAQQHNCRIIHHPRKKTFADGLEIGTELAAGKIPATAVIAYNDENAAGILKSLQSAGCRIPEEFSVTGYNNLPMTAMISPALTTIENPGFASGQAAVQNLMKMINGNPFEEAILIKPQLIIRESTGPVREF